MRSKIISILCPLKWLTIDSKDYLKNKENTKTDDLNDKEVEDKEDNGSKHTVPQHRQYLNNDGIGFGTPTDRQKQYQKYRLMKATNRLNEFVINKIKSNDDLSQKESNLLKVCNLQRDMKPQQGLERLAEDLIQESMAKGEFENLSGYGKPLKYRPEYPYLDSMTYKLNEILINNGFIPEWVVLEREIRDEKNVIKKELFSLKSQSKLENFGFVNKLLENKVKEVNKKIEKYNTILPILTKQLILLRLDNEVNKCRQMDANVDNSSHKNINNNESQSQT